MIEEEKGDSSSIVTALEKDKQAFGRIAEKGEKTVDSGGLAYNHARCLRRVKKPLTAAGWL